MCLSIYVAVKFFHSSNELEYFGTEKNYLIWQPIKLRERTRELWVVAFLLDARLVASKADTISFFFLMTSAATVWGLLTPKVENKQKIKLIIYDLNRP